MAEAIGLAIISATVESAAVAGALSSTAVIGSLTVGSLIGNVAIIGGLGVISSLISTDPNKVAAQQFSSRQPLPSRTRSYGRVKVGGPFVQYRSAGAFIYGTYHGEGPWDAIEEWWLDDIKTDLVAGSAGGTVRVVPWRGYVVVESRLGLAGQPVPATLLRTGGWDGAHVLNGCVYSAVASGLPPEKKFKAYYPKQTWSNLRVLGRAVKVRDVADAAQSGDPASWKWSDHAGPCIYDLLAHDVWGFRIEASLLNTASWVRFSELCAEPVVSKDGEVFPRYFLGGTYNLTDDLADTLAAMQAACDASLTLEPDGTIGVMGGRAPVPAFTITADMVTSLQVVAGPSLLSAYNRLKLSYVSPHHDYQQVEGEPWDDLTAQRRTGELLEQDFSRPWVQSFNQIRRLAKIAMAKGNPAFKVTAVTSLAAAPALFEEAVAFDPDDYPMFAGLIFLVTRPVANIADGTCTLEMQSLDPACYSFDALTEEGEPPAIPNASASPSPPAAPANLTVAIERRAVNGDLNATFLRLVATQPAGRQDLSLLGRYRQTGAADWSDMMPDTENTFSLTSNVLVDGAQYEVQGAVTTYGQALTSDYLAATPDPITATADPNAPDPPAGFVANGGQGRVSMAWTNSGSTNYAATRIYRGRDSAFGNATLIQSVAGAPNQAGECTDTGLNPGTYTYWAVGTNGSGTSSSPAGPVVATVT